MINEFETRQYRPKITEMKGDINKGSGWFLRRAEGVAFNKPHLLMPSLEKEILKHYSTLLDFSYKVRHQEVIQAKRLFIFFCMTYFKLTSKFVANYLNLERSTLSHHCHVILNELDIYPQTQQIAFKIDQYLYKRSEDEALRD